MPSDVSKLAAPRSALDAFGYACLIVAEADGRCLWRTALARRLMAEYFVGSHFERGYLPPELHLWLHREALRRRAGAPPAALTVLAQTAGRCSPSRAARLAAISARRLSFRLHELDSAAFGAGDYLIVMSDGR